MHRSVLFDALRIPYVLSFIWLQATMGLSISNNVLNDVSKCYYVAEMD
jgi:hypothetical protein